jgi:hypothetical protein
LIQNCALAKVFSPHGAIEREEADVQLAEQQISSPISCSSLPIASVSDLREDHNEPNTKITGSNPDPGRERTAGVDSAIPDSLGTD